MKKIRHSPALIFICGSAIAAIIIGLSLLFLDKPQCPADWYQTGATNCITGANIGLGITIMLAAGIWITSILVSLAMYARITLARKNESKWILVVQTILVIISAALVAYLVVWFLLGLHKS